MILLSFSLSSLLILTSLCSSFHSFLQMAYRGTLRQGRLAQRFYYPSLRYNVHHGDGSGENFESLNQSRAKYKISNYILPNIHKGSSINGAQGIGAFFLPSVRFMSTRSGEGSDFDFALVKVNDGGDIAEVLREGSVKVVESNTPAINEVAIAASDSAFPSAVVQYLIDAVHTFTGLNWWAAIAITTILVRIATLPFDINMIKASYKIVSDRQRVLAMRQKLQTMDIKERRVIEFFAYNELFGDIQSKEILFQSLINLSFFFAISNMVEKVPSFKNGGALWFTDLTTPDSLYILPILASFISLMHFEVLRAHFERFAPGPKMHRTGPVPSYGDIEFYSRIMAVLMVPCTMFFSKALFCYWITSLSYRFSFALALKQPEVRKVLGLPVLKPRPRTSTSNPNQSEKSD